MDDALKPGAAPVNGETAAARAVAKRKMGAGIAAGPHFRRVFQSASFRSEDAIIGPAIPRIRFLRSIARVVLQGVGLKPPRLSLIVRPAPPDVHFRAYPAWRFQRSGVWLDDPRRHRTSARRSNQVND